MNEQQALARMVAPGDKRPGKYLGGILQIHITRACDKACFNCTQGSNLGGKPVMMSVEQFDQACQSLKGYWGVVGVFGGNPAMNPDFDKMCDLMCKYFRFEQRGLWCNHPRGKGAIMRKTFNPRHSNINVHKDREAFAEFKRDWPECYPFGLNEDSRHSPCYVAMKDVVHDESERWSLISDCDINKHWSALVGVFRGELRAWFCEIAGAQSMLHQENPDYPDTGLDPTRDYEGKKWWQLGMPWFADQVRKHCHECGVPLRGYGSLALDENGVEQVSETHADIYRPKVKGRRVELVTVREQLGDPLRSTVDYMGNANRPKKETVR